MHIYIYRVLVGFVADWCSRRTVLPLTVLSTDCLVPTPLECPRNIVAVQLKAE